MAQGEGSVWGRVVEDSGSSGVWWSGAESRERGAQGMAGNIDVNSAFESWGKTGEISSGSTTTHSNISLPDYEAFYFDDDHVKEISSGSTTTHSDISLSEYDSFIFDLTHEEFADELAHIISPPEYDYFYFRNLPDPGELMSVLNSGIRENLSTTLVTLPIKDDYSPLLAYVVWIFVAYLTPLTKDFILQVSISSASIGNHVS
nr:hypothetical protein [Tanacetum cinerariifolium]